MRNCLILGSGRSGTSMAAGVLSQAGYFMGRDLYPPDEGNPKGYFENAELNGINEELLAPFLPKRPANRLGNWLFAGRLVEGQRWLAMLPPTTRFACSDSLAERIRAIVAHAPYCLKDPRFCHTLPVWLPFLDNPVFLCVFRHPTITSTSMVKEAQRDAATRRIRLRFDFKRALRVWEHLYRQILEVHYPNGGDWLFVHYQQFLDGSALPKLAERLQANLMPTFVDERLNRSQSERRLPRRIDSLYQRLCLLADYREPTNASRP